MTFDDAKKAAETTYPGAKWQHLAFKNDTSFIIHILVDDESFVVYGYVEDESGELIDQLTNIECTGALIGGMLTELDADRRAKYV